MPCARETVAACTGKTQYLRAPAQAGRGNFRKQVCPAPLWHFRNAKDSLFFQDPPNKIPQCFSRCGMCSCFCLARNIVEKSTKISKNRTKTGILVEKSTISSDGGFRKADFGRFIDKSDGKIGEFQIFGRIIDNFGFRVGLFLVTGPGDDAVRISRLAVFQSFRCMHRVAT